MTAVVDASVACKWFFQEADSAAARKVLASAEPLIAPDLIFAEVGNIGWKKSRAGVATHDQLREIAAMLPSAFVEVVASSVLLPRALEISLTLDHPVYDCMYMALAEERESRLVTADRRLLQAVAATKWKRRVKALS